MNFPNPNFGDFKGFGNFDKEFEKSKKRFTLIWRIVITIFIIGAVAFAAEVAFVGYVAYKAVPTVEQQGLKGVVDSLWYGKEGPR